MLERKIDPYRLNAMWRPGIEHKVVDCFSRHPVEVPGEHDFAGEIEVERTFRTLRMVRALGCDTGERIIKKQHYILRNVFKRNAYMGRLMGKGTLREHFQFLFFHGFWILMEDLMKKPA